MGMSAAHTFPLKTVENTLPHLLYGPLQSFSEVGMDSQVRAACLHLSWQEKAGTSEGIIETSGEELDCRMQVRLRKHSKGWGAILGLGTLKSPKGHGTQQSTDHRAGSR
jgi:hypothetical protein